MRKSVVIICGVAGTAYMLLLALVWAFSRSEWLLTPLLGFPLLIIASTILHGYGYRYWGGVCWLSTGSAFASLGGAMVFALSNPLGWMAIAIGVISSYGAVGWFVGEAEGWRMGGRGRPGTKNGTTEAGVGRGPGTG